MYHDEEFDDRGYVIESSFKHRICNRTNKESLKIRPSIIMATLSSTSRPSRRDKTMIGNYVSYVEATIRSPYSEGPANDW